MTEHDPPERLQCLLRVHGPDPASLDLLLEALRSLQGAMKKERWQRCLTALPATISRPLLLE
jgi:hypothetical protein